MSEHTSFTATESGDLIITNPYADCRFQLLQIRSALGIEIRTGMKMSRGGSALQWLRTHGVEDGPITRKATKIGAYEDLDDLMVRLLGVESRPLPVTIKGSRAAKGAAKVKS